MGAIQPQLSGYIDQTPRTLALSLTTDRVDRKEFAVFARKTQQIAGLRVDAAVIGASHIISYSAFGREFTEIFACVGLPGVAPLGLDQIKAPIRRQLGWADYSFTANVVCWDDPEPNRLVDLVALANSRANSELGIVQEFPQGSLPVTPKTVIVGYARDDSLVISTAHSYPNVRGLVLSQTTIHLNKEEGSSHVQTQ